MKKVLIITYYWPPSGGGGVQRWLKMTAFMKKYGWEPIIYTPENPAFDVKDSSLLKDVTADLTVLKTPIFEPIEVFQSAFKLIGKKPPQQKDFISERNASLFQRFATYIRGNHFIPDPRITWIGPSVRFLKKYLEKNPIDAMITSGPPHSMHLIGLKIKSIRPEIKWIADFRDPWSEWDLLDVLKIRDKAKRKHRYLESEVLKKSNATITISPYHVERLIALGSKKCFLVNNGYDARDFEGKIKTQTKKFIVRHLGSVDELRDPRPFVDAIHHLIESNDIREIDIQIEFIGPVNNAFVAHVQHLRLQNIISFLPTVPHSEVVDLYCSSTLLLLILAHTDIAAGNMPGKMYEYMASGTPILGLGPEDGNAADLIRETASGKMIERSDTSAIKEMILSHYSSWKNGQMIITSKAPSYSREALAQKTCDILNSL